MKILLFGGNGQVGTELRRSLAPLGEVIATTRDGVLADGGRCEIADFDRLGTLEPLIARISPDVVVNAAAYTAVDRAEAEPAAAFRANAEAPAVIAAACASRDVQLVHYSTDYVFNGRANRPYREDDPTDPLGVYGAGKLAGEQAVRASGARHLVFRTAWVYAAHGRNFLLTMLRLAREREELRVVADQFGTPTSARLIADATAHVLARAPGISGLWHLTAGGSTNWHGFAEAIMQAAAERGLIRSRPRIVPITTDEYPTPAARPAYSVLDTSALRADFDLGLLQWEDALSETLSEMLPSRA